MAKIKTEPKKIDFAIYTAKDLKARLGRRYILKVAERLPHLHYTAIRGAIVGASEDFDLIKEVMLAADAAVKDFAPTLEILEQLQSGLNKTQNAAL